MLRDWCLSHGKGDLIFICSSGGGLRMYASRESGAEIVKPLGQDPCEEG